METGKLVDLDPEIILISPYQFREDYGDLDELAANIAENGQQIPIRVWVKTDPDGEKIYCHDGNRRVKAILLGKEKGLLPAEQKVRALVIPEIARESEALISQFTLNNTGRSFSATETAKLCKRLQELGLTQKEIAQRLGKSQPWVSNLLKLLTLDSQVREMLDSGTTAYSAVLRQERRKRKKESTEDPVDIHDPQAVARLNLTQTVTLLLENAHSLKSVGNGKEVSLVLPKLLFNRLEDLILS